MDGTQNPNAIPRPARKPRVSNESTRSSGGLIGNLKVGQKLVVIASIFLLPVVLLTYYLITKQAQDITFAQQELIGAEFLVDTSKLVLGLQEHNTFTFEQQMGNASAAQQRQQFEAEIDQTLARLTEKNQINADLLKISATLNKVKASWSELKANAMSIKGTALHERYRALIEDQVFELINEVGNNSNITLDPEQASYYVGNILVNLLPDYSQSLEQLQRTGNEQAEIKAASNNKTLTTTDKLTMNGFAIQASGWLDETTKSIKYTIVGKPELASSLGEIGPELESSTTKLLEVVQKNFVDASSLTIPKTAFYSVSEAPIAAIAKLYSQSQPAFVQLVQERIVRLQGQQLLEFGGVALVLALASLITFIFIRSITRPIGALVGVVEKVGQGDLSQEVQIGSKDEIGVLANAVNISIQNLRETERRNQEEIERTRSLQTNIGEFLDVTMDISQGNLTRKGRVSDDVLGNVVDAINLMTEEIGYLLKDVERVAQQVNDGSNDVSTTNNAILEGAQAQSGIAQKARAQALEVTNSIRAMAQKALETAQASQQTLQASQAGQVALQETLSGMQNIRREVQGISKSIKSLSDRSLEISEIAETISGIAAQTNMLALNAAIEASGAGEAGARFAIVADEVRKLAEDSARATGRVTNLIKNIQNEVQSVVIGVEGGTREVEQGYKIATQAGERLKEIAQLATQSAALVQTISSATRAQAGGVEQVKNAVEAIAQSASQTEAQSNQGRQSAADLQKLSLELTSSLSRFQLPS